MKENSRGIHENNRMGGERSHYLFSSVAQRLELSEINWRSLAMMPLVTLPVCIFNLLVRVQYQKPAGIFAGMLLIIYCLLLLVFTRRGKRRFVRYATGLAYLAEIPVMLITIVQATVLKPDVAAVTSLLFMAILPPFILDLAYRVIAFETVWAGVLIVMSFITKESSLFKMDVLHLVLAYLLSVCAIRSHGAHNAVVILGILAHLLARTVAVRACAHEQTENDARRRKQTSHHPISHAMVSASRSQRLPFLS